MAQYQEELLCPDSKTSGRPVNSGFPSELYYIKYSTGYTKVKQFFEIF